MCRWTNGPMPGKPVLYIGINDRLEMALGRHAHTHTRLSPYPHPNSSNKPSNPVHLISVYPVYGVCVCVCVCLYMGMCVYVCVYVCVHVSVYVCVGVYGVCVCVCVQSCVTSLAPRPRLWCRRCTPWVYHHPNHPYHPNHLHHTHQLCTSPLHIHRQPNCVAGVSSHMITGDHHITAASPHSSGHTVL